MSPHPSRIVTAVASAGLLVTAFAASPGADAAGDPGARTVQSGADVHEMTARFIAQDKGISLEQARARVAAEPRQTAQGARLEAGLGAHRTGGSYLDDQGRLVVTVVDGAAAQAVRADGATARTVARSSAQLATTEQRVRSALGTGFTAIGTDVVANTVTVTVAQGEVARTRAALRGVDGVTVVGTKASYGTQANVYGGQQIAFNGYVCSLGFNAKRGTTPVFITAGHCGEGYPTFTRNGVTLGKTQAYSFPGNDYAYSSLTSSWTGMGSVDMYNGYARAVKGSSNAAVGSAVCKSGRTTGWTCGYVKAKSQTVNYGNNDIVSGLTLANACTEGGDSGGSWLAGNYAQGVTSGGAMINGRCLETQGQENQTYFQPVGEILSAYGLTLTTS
ncbi:S1 family peptidase [Luteipulveratus halotolerans]|uniref:Serine protease n=1 Tax=Luteipulveratus halotolerans TaxID=1631356 RepID=A0A0L6CI69_9MICO|nr:S1 family peptidase [Luteipulveratus halotolerans]KNX37429.1 serine protease [Luteipulveratus halotolerans]